MIEAQEAVERLRKKYGSLRKAAKACGSTTATFSRIKAGLQEPTEETLAKLGLARTVTYSKASGKARR